MMHATSKLSAYELEMHIGRAWLVSERYTDQSSATDTPKLDPPRCHAFFLLSIVAWGLGCLQEPLHVAEPPEPEEVPRSSGSPRVTGVGQRPLAPTPLFVFDTEVTADITIPPKDTDPSDPDAMIETDPLVELPTGDQQLAILCARGRSNAITTAFCTNPRPTLTRLLDVQSLLGLSFANPSGNNGQNGNPAFALNGHSSSLVMKSVSAINPRAIVFTRNPGTRNDQNLVLMGFVRGDQLVELAVVPPQGGPTFYLLRYEQPCSVTKTCSHGDLLSAATEQNWIGYTLYEDVDLENTVFDCLQCHQPQGPSTAKILRMQELNTPWTHWFRNNRSGGLALLADYTQAHGINVGYGPIPGQMIQRSDPELLEDLLEGNGFAAQPNEFNGNAIENEVQDVSNNQPVSNVPPGASATWQRLYDAAVRGEVIPPPYHDVKVTDPGLLSAHAFAIASVRQGSMPLSSMPDIRLTFLDSAKAAMSIRPRPGLDGRGILMHMCAQCHNSRLNQTISRALFNAMALDTMSRSEKDEALRRLTMPIEDRRHMPPEMFKELSQQELTLVLDVLSR